MSFNPGDKLGPYEIIAAIGAGGMGEVYKARDTRLDRTVAVKVLPQRTAADADLRARFEREARAISRLNHPHICTLHDVGHQDETDYLVMEFLEGETLSDRLSKGVMPVEELLQTAIQIADALDTAHRQGLIHRDLKPGNVMLTRDGAKLLDFGLAKLTVKDGVVDGVTGVTRTTPLTGEGTIIGTLQYMSPEQLEGAEADGRSDIFAFGAMLYEMATGRRAFSGGSQASLIASVMREEPRSVSEVEPTVPPALDRLIKKCLAKNPDYRWQSSRDLADELRWIERSGSQAGIPAIVSARRRFQLRLSWLIAIAATCLAVVFATMIVTRETPVPRVTRFTMTPIPEAFSLEWPRISPDGTLLALRVADSTGRYQIWIRPLNSLDPYPLPGTEGARRPFWSPDSRYLAFFAGDQLKKVPASGGPAQFICRVAGGYDGCWGKEGVILFDGGANDSIRQVPASGGIPSAATIIDRSAGELFHGWPWFLPDGNHFLFTASSDSTDDPVRELVLKVGSLNSFETKTLGTVESRIEYCEPGYVLYMKNDFLVAQAFDIDNLELVGAPLMLTENVSRVGASNQGVNFCASDDGVLVVQKGASSPLSALVWVDRNGIALDTIGDPAAYADIALSPDNTRIAYSMYATLAGPSDIWVRDLERGVSSRLTFGADGEWMPVWSADGARVAYSTFFGSSAGISYRSANGTGDAVPLYAPDSGFADAMQWTKSDRLLVGLQSSSLTRHVMALIPVDHPDQIQKLSLGSFRIFPYGLSPDERFLLYTSDETGRDEVYVRDLQAAGGRWQVSTERGDLPRWRSDGNEIFYFEGDDLMAVDVTYAGGFKTGIPRRLFTARGPGQGIFTFLGYDVAADGRRFLMKIPIATQEAGKGKFEVILNWPEELKDR